MQSRRPTKRDSLLKIVDLGVPIETVIDVGILTGTYDLRTIFADRKQLLIEPIEEWNAAIEKNYAKSNVDFEILNVAAADQDGFMQMELSSVKPGSPITHARLTSKPKSDALRTVPVCKPDSIIAARPHLRKPFLLKVDVDGAEIQVLDGARAILPDCNVIVIEAGIRTFIERTNWVHDAGFTLFDIVDICYYDNRLRQFDLVFLNTRMMDARNLDMYKQPFDIEKWAAF